MGFTPPRPYSARTDDDGRFTIRELPAGEYSLNARRAGYVDQGFGQVTPNTPPRRVTVAEGAALGPLDFQLLRGGVITGRVVDETGEPAERVQVRVVRSQRVGGQSRVVGFGMGDTTDDQGQYRLFGLAPGEYLVVAEPNDRRGFMMGQNIQGVDVDTIPTYGPGTVNPAEAQKVVVQAGLEAAMDIQLVAAKVATVRGRVVTSNGEPMSGGMVRLMPAGGDFAGMGKGGPVMGEGRFEIDGVAPGTYTVMAQMMMRGGPDGPDESGPAPEAAMQTITVEGEDVDVALTTSPGSTARGRVVVEGGNPGALAHRELRIGSYSVGPTAPMGFGFPARGRAAADLSFEIKGVRGTQMLTVQGLPEGWWTKELRVAGQTVADSFDFGNGRTVNSVEIVVSGLPTGLTGTVTLPTGSTASDYAVVLFPEDETRWEPSPGMGMGVRIVRPGLDGAFKLPGVKPATYYMLAVPASQAEYQTLNDPDQLRMLAGKARTVEVKDGVMTPVSLTLVDR
jgi:protocatechuate 3,4-dioxygenase beta subunit